MSNVIELKPTDANFRKAFGVFVGLFNRTNGTRYAVKQAMKIPTLIALYESTSKAMTVANDVFVDQVAQAMPSGSTKARSYALVDLPETRKRVYDFIQSNPNVSRRQIADGTGLLMSSVCARVNELLAEGAVYVSGERFDHQTDRNVETLAPAPEAA